jgi:CRP-like cAMP-binding protein
VSREARGRPLLIEELSRYLGDARDEDGLLTFTSVSDVTLEQAWSARLRRLDESAHRVLEVLAVAQVPVDLEIVGRVVAACAGPSHSAAAGSSDVRLLVGQLSAQRWVRNTRHQGMDAVELSHEPLGKFILGQLRPDDHVEINRCLALEWQSAGRGDSETLTRLFREARLPELSVRHALAAAERASNTLAFERATHLLEDALELEVHPGERWGLLVRLADALLGNGRVEDAVARLAQAAREAPPLDAARLTKRIFQLQLRGTRFDTPIDGATQEGHSLFDGISREEVQAFLSDADVVEAAAGDVIARRGEAASSFLVVLSGAVEVRRGGLAGARLGEGTVLSAVEFLLQSERNTELRAASDDARVLSLSRNSLDRLIAANPSMALELVLNLSRILCSRLVLLQRKVFGAMAGG